MRCKRPIQRSDITPGLVSNIRWQHHATEHGLQSRPKVLNTGSKIFIYALAWHKFQLMCGGSSAPPKLQACLWWG